MPDLHDEAAEEFAEVAEHYERRQVGLGARFIREALKSLDRIDEAPLSGSLTQAEAPLPVEVRKMPVRSFPYRLVYVVEPRLVVVAFAHERRRPGYWHSRLP